jgi:cation/acetate symporter
MVSATVQFLPLAIVAGMFAVLILSGLRTRSQQATDYGFHGGYTSRVGIGAAIASNWMSAASFMGLAGMFYLKGYYAMAFVVGWTGGYVLLLVLMASQIRRFGKFTAPDFVGFRYESANARTLVAFISILIAVIYSVAQFRGIALLVSWLFGIEYTPAVIIGAAMVVLLVVVSGTMGVARNQKLQYFVLIVAFIIPLMLLTRKLGYFWLLPQFGYGAAITDLHQQFGFAWSEPFSSVSLFHWLALCFTLMFGTAGLPHVLSRFYMVPGIRDARWGVVWGLFFIALIYWSAPAYGVLGRLFEARGGHPFTPDPASADMVILTAVSHAGLPLWVVGLLVAGGMSAAFSAAAGLMLTGSASFSYDIYPRLLRPNASENDKVYAAKGFFLLLAVVVLLLTLRPWGMIAEIAALAFALAGNTIFPTFLLGIWWGRANATGAIVGMVSGLVITFLPFVLRDAVPALAYLLPVTSSAFIGAPLVVAIMMVVSLLTEPPSENIRCFLAKNVHDCTEE